MHRNDRKKGRWLLLLLGVLAMAALLCACSETGYATVEGTYYQAGGGQQVLIDSYGDIILLRPYDEADEAALSKLTSGDGITITTACSPYESLDGNHATNVYGVKKRWFRHSDVSQDMQETIEALFSGLE